MKKLICISLFLALSCVLFFQIDFQGFRQITCPFCDPEILERQTFYRSGGALGILTYKPAVLGHVLIIPERHVERFEDLKREEILAIGEAIQKVNQQVRRSLGDRDYLLLQKNGYSVGQSVSHLHFHYIPASKFLIARLLIASWFKPMNQEKLKRLKETLSEPF